MDRKARTLEFNERLQALLSEFHADIVPLVDSDGEDCPHFDDPCVCEPPANMHVIETVLCLNWLDLDKDDTFSSHLASPHMRVTHIAGLLYDILDT